ncbi:hypothetical protein ABUW04_01625 [Streptacidiphilus sp. N1-10]|uniref:Uncharacterized protein n=1 Tax=Streptacidiphilus jeojiensis TaxID=3229225 RepID=A0ABV6XFA5_9ACTN
MMESILSGLSEKVTERWAALLVLPGIAFAMTLLLACWLRPLGATRQADPHAVVGRLDMLPHGWLRGETHQVVLVGAGVLVALVSAAAANELSRFIGRFWLGRHRGIAWLMRRPLARRRTRARAAVTDAARYRVPEIYLPTRATRIGDCFLLVQRRVQVQYAVDLGRLWPRVWQLCGEGERVLTQQAWDQYSAAAVRAAWSVGYFVLALYWWPAVFIGVLLGPTACVVARRSAAGFAMAVESLVDLKISETATVLGVPLPQGRFTRAEGAVLESIFDKGSMIPVPPVL